jgi:hypothetical protein
VHGTVCTALHCAIYRGYATCCVVCLKAGIDADVGDLEGLCGGEVLQAATSISTDVRVGSSCSPSHSLPCTLHAAAWAYSL